MTRAELSSKAIEVDDALDAIELYYRNGWTDGLPVVPPTEDAVWSFLERSGHAPDDVLGAVPARRRIITAEKVAINAIMAGCLPAYVPVIVAAIEAMSDEAFNLHGSTVTTGGPAPLVIVNGPIARELEINAGVNIFGPGWRANATIGRAIRLILVNVCGTRPGVMDKATLGHPGKYSYCIAEDEENSAWEPLHVQRGLPAGSSAVTVFSADAPKQVFNENGTTPEEILDSVACTMKDGGSLGTPGSGEFLVVVPPQHREHIDRKEWGKKEIQQYLFEQTRVTMEDYRRAAKLPRRPFADPEKAMPLVEKPEDIMVIAGGGPAGGFSAVVPPWFGRVSKAVTKEISGR